MKSEIYRKITITDKDLLQILRSRGHEVPENVKITRIHETLIITWLEKETDDA